jgi:hypothetical protein
MKNQNGGQNVKSHLMSGCLLLVFVAVTAAAPAQAPGGLITVLIFEDNDQASGKPMMQAIIDALTLPLTENEKIKGSAPEAAAEPRQLKPDTEENLQRLFKDKDWTDYNPIILPTESRAAKMLTGTSHKPDEVVKTINWPGGARTWAPILQSKLCIMKSAAIAG